MNQSNSSVIVKPIIIVHWQMQSMTVLRGGRIQKLVALTPKIRKALVGNDRFASHNIYDGGGTCGVELTPKTAKQRAADKRKAARREREQARRALGLAERHGWAGHWQRR